MNNRNKIMIVVAILLVVTVGLTACFAPAKTNDETVTTSPSTAPQR